MERNCQVAEEEEDDLHEQEEDIFGDDEDNPIPVSGKNCQNTQFCRIKGCGGAMIFERLKLPQQIIYRRKGNLSEKIKAIMYFAKFLSASVKPRNLNFSRNKLYIWNLQITRFKMIYDMFVF